MTGKRTYASWLFGIGAGFNASVAMVLFFFRAWLVHTFRLSPVTGSNIVLLDLAAVFILLFAWSMALVAIDPVRYRVYVSLNAIGKLAAVALALYAWAAGLVSAKLLALFAGDFILALLFLSWLQGTRGQPAGATR